MLLPVAVPIGRAGVIDPVLLVWHQILRKFVTEGVRTVLLLVFLELLGCLANILWAVKFIDVLLELSALDQSAHSSLLQ
jgi:hypothetical protein